MYIVVCIFCYFVQQTGASMGFGISKGSQNKSPTKTKQQWDKQTKKISKQNKKSIQKI